MPRQLAAVYLKTNLKLFSMRSSTHKKNSSLTRVQSKQGDVFLERIPDNVYQQMVALFADQYHFKNGTENGGRMRLANYYVGISRSIATSFIQFIEEIKQGIPEGKYPGFPVPEGFNTHTSNMLQTEVKGGWSFDSFDMAVTEEGLQNIEFQAVPTYPISAAKLNQCLLHHLPCENAFIFADDPATSWEDFTDLYHNIISDNCTEGVVITDRLLKQQKTNFEFYATQKELHSPIAIVDMEDIFESDNELFYSNPSTSGDPIKITRLYNRILLSEALFEDNYPQDAKTWRFRFDTPYTSLKFINHPIKLYDVSKRLSPYVRHPYNPDCFELSEVAEDFRKGSLKYDDFIWKHKWGAAGQRLILSPDEAILNSLSEELNDYIAQKKVDFEIFRTDDGQEKIVELRFMTAQHHNKSIIVPMARIGHVVEDSNGIKKFKIHFGDNNKEGYGFSPVLIFDD